VSPVFLVQGEDRELQSAWMATHDLLELFLEKLLHLADGEVAAIYQNLSERSALPRPSLDPKAIIYGLEGDISFAHREFTEERPLFSSFGDGIDRFHSTVLDLEHLFELRFGEIMLIQKDSPQRKMFLLLDPDTLLDLGGLHESELHGDRPEE
jgi:hypothetical protein